MGVPTDAGTMVALEMPYGPLEHLSAMGAQSRGPYNDFVDMQIRVTQVAPIPGAPNCMGLIYDQCAQTICRELEGWHFLETVDDDHPLRCGWFQPKMASGEKKPLASFNIKFGIFHPAIAIIMEVLSPRNYAESV